MEGNEFFDLNTLGEADLSFVLLPIGELLDIAKGIFDWDCIGYSVDLNFTLKLSSIGPRFFVKPAVLNKFSRLLFSIIFSELSLIGLVCLLALQKLKLKKLKSREND